MPSYLRERLMRDLPWVGRDLDSQVKYALRLSAELKLPLADVQAWIGQIYEVLPGPSPSKYA